MEYLAIGIPVVVLVIFLIIRSPTSSTRKMAKQYAEKVVQDMLQDMEKPVRVQVKEYPLDLVSPLDLEIASSMDATPRRSYLPFRSLSHTRLCLPEYESSRSLVRDRLEWFLSHAQWSWQNLLDYFKVGWDQKILLVRLERDTKVLEVHQWIRGNEIPEEKTQSLFDQALRPLLDKIRSFSGEIHRCKDFEALLKAVPISPRPLSLVYYLVLDSKHLTLNWEQWGALCKQEKRLGVLCFNQLYPEQQGNLLDDLWELPYYLGAYLADQILQDWRGALLPRLQKGFQEPRLKAYGLVPVLQIYLEKSLQVKDWGWINTGIWASEDLAKIAFQYLPEDRIEQSLPWIGPHQNNPVVSKFLDGYFKAHPHLAGSLEALEDREKGTLSES